MLSRKSMMMSLAACAMTPGVSFAQTSNAGREGALKAALLRPDSLAYHAAKAGMLFGTMIGRDFLADAPYVAAVSRECSVICATLISAAVTRRSQGGFDFRSGDEQVAFARSHDLAIDGGYLIVHGNEPAWITPTTERGVALAELQLIVTTTMKRYAGQLDHWIVVNEAISPQGLRNCTWLSAVGPDYIAQAFKAARQAAPQAVLVLNENNLEDDGDTATKKRAVMLNLLTSLVKGGTPIDALGMQAHLRAGKHIDPSALDRFLNGVHELGLKVVITEMDVIDADLASDLAARDSAVAQTFSEFLKLVLKHPGVTSISVWGLSDTHSWYNKSSTPSSLRRGDGLPSRGTLLDQDLARKPAYYAVRDALDTAARS